MKINVLKILLGLISVCDKREENFATLTALETLER
jgi:hypothetical protein